MPAAWRPGAAAAPAAAAATRTGPQAVAAVRPGQTTLLACQESRTRRVIHGLRVTQAARRPAAAGSVSAPRPGSACHSVDRRASHV